MLRDLIDGAIVLVRDHQAWGPPIVLLLAFGESIAFLSLLIPATVILIGVGALVGQAGLPFVPIWLAAVIGAVLGDWISYWIGYRYKGRAATLWPLNKYPAMLPRGYAFFDRWGWAGVFAGRFLGPLRATVPLVAGICAMPLWAFQITNIASAIVWAMLLLAPGAFGVRWLEGWIG